MVGIISLLGTIVTLVDVRRKLRHPAADEDTENTRIVVIDLRTETIGFVVDRVVVVQSTLSPKGSRYDVRAEAGLGEGGETVG